MKKLSILIISILFLATCTGNSMEKDATKAAQMMWELQQLKVKVVLFTPSTMEPNCP